MYIRRQHLNDIDVFNGSNADFQLDPSVSIAQPGNFSSSSKATSASTTAAGGTNKGALLLAAAAVAAYVLMQK